MKRQFQIDSLRFDHRPCLRRMTRGRLWQCDEAHLCARQGTVQVGLCVFGGSKVEVQMLARICGTVQIFLTSSAFSIVLSVLLLIALVPVAAVAGDDVWSTINNELTNTSVLALVIDPLDSQIIYVGTDGGGVFKSTNRGDSWTESNNGLTNKNVRTLVINPVNRQVVYAGTGKGVFRSIDGGRSWKVFGPDLNVPIQALAIAPATSSRPQALYAGTQDGVSRFLIDDSNYWITFKTGLINPNVRALAVDPSNPLIVYAGTDGGGVFKSTNGGGSYDSTAMISTSNDYFIYALAIDPSDSRIIYAGTAGKGMFKSIDGGKSWVPFNKGIEDILKGRKLQALAINPASPQVVYAGTDGVGVFKSKDGGKSWTDTGLKTDPTVRALAIDPLNPQRVYAGV